MLALQRGAYQGQQLRRERAAHDPQRMQDRQVPAGKSEQAERCCSKSEQAEEQPAGGGGTDDSGAPRALACSRGPPPTHTHTHKERTHRHTHTHLDYARGEVCCFQHRYGSKLSLCFLSLISLITVEHQQTHTPVHPQQPPSEQEAFISAMFVTF
jgi:hypothetical protein